MDVCGLFLREHNCVAPVKCQTIFRLACDNTERENSQDLNDINDLHNLQEYESDVESQSDSETESEEWE
jgi:hypothetical protein